MSEQKTGVEVLWDFLSDTPNPFSVGDCMAPEGCFEMFGEDGRRYSVSVEACEDELITAQEVSAHISGPPAAPTPVEDSTPNKLPADFMREAEDAVRKAQEEIAAFAESQLLQHRNQFDVIALDLLDTPMVMCHATSLEDLFDLLGPWHVEGMLGLYEKVNIVRALRAAPDNNAFNQGVDCDFTKPFQINEDFPQVIIQLS